MTNPTITAIEATPTADGSEGLLAIVFHSNGVEDVPMRDANGTMFLTPPQVPMQAALIRRGKGETIASHRHPSQSRMISTTPEAIIVTKGSVTVSLYTSEGDHERDVELKAGDMIIMYAGGHGFSFNDDTHLFEVKQGPYNSARDKIYYDKSLSGE